LALDFAFDLVPFFSELVQLGIHLVSELEETVGFCDFGPDVVGFVLESYYLFVKFCLFALAGRLGLTAVAGIIHRL
jgi:hypothetical protein